MNGISNYVHAYVANWDLFVSISHNLAFMQSNQIIYIKERTLQDVKILIMWVKAVWWTSLLWWKDEQVKQKHLLKMLL